MLKDLLLKLNELIVAVGGGTSIGDPDDAAQTDASQSGSLIAFTKGLVSTLFALLHLGQSTRGNTDGGIDVFVVRKDVAADTAGGNGQRGVLQTDSVGQLRVAPGQITTGTPTVVAVEDSATVVTLAALNEDRIGVSIYNDSTADLKLKAGATASASSFTAVLQGKITGDGARPGGYWEAPFGYEGIITGIWDSDAGGNALVTEFES